MIKRITLRLSEENYEKICKFAKRANRKPSNFIEHTVFEHIKDVKKAMEVPQIFDPKT